MKTFTEADVLKALSHAKIDVANRAVVLDSLEIEDPKEIVPLDLTREQLENIYAFSYHFEYGYMNSSGNGSEIANLIYEIYPDIAKSSVERLTGKYAGGKYLFDSWVEDLL